MCFIKILQVVFRGGREALHNCEQNLQVQEFCEMFLKFKRIRRGTNGELPVPVAAGSKAWVYGRPPAEIVGSNPTWDMNVCLL